MIWLLEVAARRPWRPWYPKVFSERKGLLVLIFQNSPSIEHTVEYEHDHAPISYAVLIFTLYPLHCGI